MSGLFFQAGGAFYRRGRSRWSPSFFYSRGRDRVFVVGPNGKGKTTLLKLLAGALQPQAGTVTTPQSAAMGYFEQTNVATL